MDHEFPAFHIGIRCRTGQITNNDRMGFIVSQINDGNCFTAVISYKQFLIGRATHSSNNAHGTQSGSEAANRSQTHGRVGCVAVYLPFNNFEGAAHCHKEAITNDGRPFWKGTMHPLQFRRNIAFDVPCGRFCCVRSVAYPVRMSFVTVGAKDVVRFHVLLPSGNLQAREINCHQIILDIAHLEIPGPINGVEGSHYKLLFNGIGVGCNRITQYSKLGCRMVPLPSLATHRVAGGRSTKTYTGTQGYELVPLPLGVLVNGKEISEVLNKNGTNFSLCLHINHRDIHGAGVGHKEMIAIRAKHEIFRVTARIAYRNARTSNTAFNPVNDDRKIRIFWLEQHTTRMEL